MFGLLDLTWKPTSATDTTPPPGKAGAITRGDTYEHTLRVTDGALLGFDLFDWSAQLRRARLTAATAGDPEAEFTVVLTVDGDDLLVTLGLAAEDTLGLPHDLFWDLQYADGDVITTLLAGKVKVLDDVTRAATGS